MRSSLNMFHKRIATAQQVRCAPAAAPRSFVANAFNLPSQFYMVLLPMCGAHAPICSLKFCCGKGGRILTQRAQRKLSGELQGATGSKIKILPKGGDNLPPLESFAQGLVACANLLQIVTGIKMALG